MPVILSNLQIKKTAYENRKTKLTPAFNKTLKRALVPFKDNSIEGKKNTILFKRAKNFNFSTVAIPKSNDNRKPIPCWTLH
jgi:hypothetical protein